jgi:hypothetical protein
VSLSVLLLLALPSSLQREHWRSQLAAVVVEVGIRVGPAWLACLAWNWYWPNRTLVVAACRLASAALPRLAVQPALPAAGWGGWHHFLLLTRALGVNTLPWLARLPFKVGGSRRPRPPPPPAPAQRRRPAPHGLRCRRLPLAAGSQRCGCNRCRFAARPELLCCSCRHPFLG